MNRILRTVIIISFAYISHTHPGPRPVSHMPDNLHMSTLSRAIEPVTAAQPESDEQPGCFAMVRRALNNRVRRLIPSRQIAPMAPPPAQNIPREPHRRTSALIASPIPTIPVISSQPPCNDSITVVASQTSDGSTHHEHNADACTVCQHPIEGNDDIRRTLPCTHAFHTECDNPWITRHNTCPNCRHIVDPAVANQDDNELQPTFFDLFMSFAILMELQQREEAAIYGNELR